LIEINDYWQDAFFEFHTWFNKENAFVLSVAKVAEVLEKLEEDILQL